MGYKNVTRNSNKIIINPLSEYETDLLLNKILKYYYLKTLKYYLFAYIKLIFNLYLLNIMIQILKSM